MYISGRGVSQNFILAHKWLILAAPTGPKKAAKFRDDIAKHMTPAQIAEAQHLARKWAEAFKKRRSNGG